MQADIQLTDRNMDPQAAAECDLIPGTQYKKPSLTGYAAWSAVFVAATGLWQYGYAIGSINAAYVPVTNSVRSYYDERYNETTTDEAIQAIWTVLSAAFPLGGIFGSLLVGQIVRRFGRLRGLLLGHCLTACMSFLCGISGVLKAPELIIVSRVGLGIATGMAGTGITVMYIAEVSPRHLRGAFGTLTSTFIAVSLTLSNAFGLPQALGNEALWPLLLALTGVPSLFFILLVKTLANSPRQLYLENHDVSAATETLQRLTGYDDVSEELQEMDTEMEQSNTKVQMTLMQLIKSSSLRRATVAALVLAAAQQITGLNGISINMNSIYLEAGFSNESVYYISIAVNGLVVFINLGAGKLVEKFGRKALLSVGYLVEGISLLILTVSIETKDLSPALPYVSIVASIGFWVGFGMGPGPVTLLTIAEFFDQTSRSAAITLSAMVLWITFTTAVLVTPYMLNAMHGYTFLPFGVLAFLSLGFIRIYVPETKNKPFSEIQSSFIAQVKT